jgi:membrane protein implicated in regulation of membrane protease activity
MEPLKLILFAIGMIVWWALALFMIGAVCVFAATHTTYMWPLIALGVILPGAVFIAAAINERRRRNRKSAQ